MRPSATEGCAKLYENLNGHPLRYARTPNEHAGDNHNGQPASDDTPYSRARVVDTVRVLFGAELYGVMCEESGRCVLRHSAQLSWRCPDDFGRFAVHRTDSSNLADEAHEEALESL